MNKLQNFIDKEALEFLARFLYTSIVCLWSLFTHLDDLLCSLLNLDVSKIFVFACKKKLVVALRVQGEPVAKKIFRPLDTVEGFFRKHFQGAVRYLCVGLGILLRRVRLCFEGNNNLNMALRTKGAAVDHGNSRLDALIVDIESRLNVV